MNQDTTVTAQDAPIDSTCQCTYPDQCTFWTPEGFRSNPIPVVLDTVREMLEVLRKTGYMFPGLGARLAAIFCPFSIQQHLDAPHEHRTQILRVALASLDLGSNAPLVLIQTGNGLVLRYMADMCRVALFRNMLDDTRELGIDVKDMCAAFIAWGLRCVSVPSMKGGLAQLMSHPIWRPIFNTYAEITSTLTERNLMDALVARVARLMPFDCESNELQMLVPSLLALFCSETPDRSPMLIAFTATAVDFVGRSTENLERFREFYLEFFLDLVTRIMLLEVSLPFGKSPYGDPDAEGAVMSTKGIATGCFMNLARYYHEIMFPRFLRGEFQGSPENAHFLYQFPCCFEDEYIEALDYLLERYVLTAHAPIQFDYQNLEEAVDLLIDLRRPSNNDPVSEITLRRIKARLACLVETQMRLFTQPHRT